MYFREPAYGRRICCQPVLSAPQGGQAFYTDLGPASDIGVFDGVFDVDLSETVSYDDLHCGLGEGDRSIDAAWDSLLFVSDALSSAGAGVQLLFVHTVF